MLRSVFRVAALGLVLGAACARIPARPPQLPPPVTRLYEQPYPVVWDTVRVDLNSDPRLELDTVDKRGRFVAWERTNSLILLLNSRNVVTVNLEAVGESNTRMVLQMSHQKYDAGGLTRPAMYHPPHHAERAYSASYRHASRSSRGSCR